MLKTSFKGNYVVQISSGEKDKTSPREKEEVIKISPGRKRMVAKAGPREREEVIKNSAREEVSSSQQRKQIKTSVKEEVQRERGGCQNESQ